MCTSSAYGICQGAADSWSGIDKHLSQLHTQPCAVRGSCVESSAASHPCTRPLAPSVVHQPAPGAQIWSAAVVVVGAVTVPCTRQII